MYKSTPYPEDLSILFHNESSHLPQWPMRQFFSCIVAPQSGGQTPIVDCRTVLDRMRPELAEQFATKKLRYVRNFIDGVDVSWSRFFGTEDPAEVERKCAAEGTSFEWTPERRAADLASGRGGAAPPDDRRGRVLQPAGAAPPIVAGPGDARLATGDLRRSGDAAQRLLGRRHVIDDALVDEVRDLMDRESVAFSWQEGDVLVIDNMLVAHSRSPFTGPRKIVVALGDMTGEAVPA